MVAALYTPNRVSKRQVEIQAEREVQFSHRPKISQRAANRDTDGSSVFDRLYEPNKVRGCLPDNR